MDTLTLVKQILSLDQIIPVKIRVTRFMFDNEGSRCVRVARPAVHEDEGKREGRTVGQRQAEGDRGHGTTGKETFFGEKNKY